MRLSLHEITAIKAVVQEQDPQANVYLFGSRVDDAKKGGDIDLIVESTRIEFGEKLAVLAGIKRRIGDQKIDILITKDLALDQRAFVRAVALEAKKL